MSYARKLDGFRGRPLRPDTRPQMTAKRREAARERMLAIAEGNEEARCKPETPSKGKRLVG